MSVALARVSNVYCSLCGVVLAIPDMNAVHLPKPERPWFCDIRAVFIDRGVSTGPFLSSVGFLVSPCTLAANLDSTVPFSSTPPSSRIFLNQQYGQLWGYGFHDDCWMLLLAKLSHSQIVDERMVVKSVFRLFYYTECPNFSSFSFGHGYGGVAQKQDPLGDRHSVSQDVPEGANPYLLPPWEELEEYASTILNAKTLKEFALPNSAVGDISSTSHIHKLPPEIFYLIVQNLPIADVANLRLACQDFALKTTAKKLPRAFWKSRFLPGFELDYILPGTVVHPKDWLHMFCGIMAYIKLSYKPLANKKRIWNVLDHFVGVVKFSGNWSTRAPPENGRRVYLESSTPERGEIFRLGNSKPGTTTSFLASKHSLSGRLVFGHYNSQLTKGCKAPSV